MREILLGLILLSFCIPGSAQVITPVHQPSDLPDFGIHTGALGIFQIHRPYGLQNIQLADARDLISLHLVNGEPLSLHQGWWYGNAPHTPWWERLHEPLSNTEDSTTSLIEVNYKQTIYGFKDFNLYHHRAISDRVFLGMHSEMRKYPRFDMDPYEQQNHRLQVSYLNASGRTDVELGTIRLTLPLYIYSTDTTGVEYFDISRKQHRELYSGQINHTFQASSLGISDIYAQLRGGRWTWQDTSHLEWSGLGVLNGFLPVARLRLNYQLGYFEQSLDSLNRSGLLLRMATDTLKLKRLEGKLGLWLLGASHLQTEALLMWRTTPMQIYLSSKALLFDPGLLDDYELGSVNELGILLGSRHLQLHAGLWGATIGRQGSTQGYRFRSSVHLPWQIHLQVDYQELLEDESSVFTWDLKRLNWRLNKDLNILKGKALAQLSVWGVHHFQTAQAYLREADLVFEPIPATRNSDAVHRLNYSISMNIRSLTLALTDLNILHDLLWESYFPSDWEFQYVPVQNQQPDYRFQYLTLIWVFED